MSKYRANLRVRVVSLVAQDLVPKYSVATSRQSRMSPFDRLLHIQARMQAQVFRENIRRMHGFVLRIALSGYHEQAIPLHTWWS